MTTFERFEREIPDLMAELAPERVPDYFDDMLRRATATGQRPAWSALERWLPMGVTALSAPTPRVPWRYLALIVAVLLIAAASLVYVGSRRTAPPAPFGPARNGGIVFSTPDGEIVRADPETGKVTNLIAGEGSAFDTDPWFSNDGSTFAFDRRTSISDIDRALFLADADGSNIRQVVGPDTQIKWFEWSPTGDRMLIVRHDDPARAITLVDSTTGQPTTLDVDFDATVATFRPGSDDLVVSGPGEFFLVGSKTGDVRRIVEDPYALAEQFTVSPDGSTLAYASWVTGAEGRIHVIDIATGTDRGIDFDPGFDYTDLSPVFSPDGTKIMVHRSDVDGYRLTLLPTDGHGPAVPMGDHHPDKTNGARAAFSPDGTKVMATYQDDLTTWLLDTTTGTAEPAGWSVPGMSYPSWQRLAP